MLKEYQQIITDDKSTLQLLLERADQCALKLKMNAPDLVKEFMTALGNAEVLQEFYNKEESP